MASTKINPKGKSKDEKTKIIKSLSTIGEDSEDLDFALLRKPIQTSITGFAQARKIFDLATEELKDLLSNECDILYECKVCRNIFRSLANFLSHKRVYCKDKFNTSTHGHFIEPCSMAQEVQKIKNMEKGYQESLRNETKNEDVDRIPLTKDLTSIIEKISMNKEMFVDVPDNQQVVLRNIPNSSVAVFQNINNEGNSQDNMQAEVGELTEILSRDKAILQEDGSFKIQSSVKMPLLPENVIQISDDDDGDEQPKCKLCGQKFSTMKTLKFHMKYKHLESRLVYPCPDCLEIFSTSWSVYRHLFKVHRKTAAQIRRLRESIQAKAFRLNNPPAFYEKRKNNNSKLSNAQKITEEERLEQENQEWMDNMEGDSEIPRCGGCGRTFERRAALAAHTNTCQPRSRALNRKAETKKIEIQIRKDYIKPPKTQEKCIEITEKDTLEEAIMEVDCYNFNKNEKSKEKSSLPEETKEKSMSPVKQCEYSLDDIIPSIQLPFAQQAEKSNMAALKSKMAKDIIIENLTCRLCNIKSKNVQKLFDHMADHYKWLRYACKLCNFKHYTYERLPQHVKEVHKLRGDSDFYFSTIKALEGSEALDLADVSEDQHDDNDSIDSRRPSRCSSDSSRLSDDSSSSCARTDMSNRKRKQIPQKHILKKRKDNDDDEQSRDGIDNAEGDTNLSSKFDENSSDIEDIEEKLAKRTGDTKAQPIRRPVRNKTKRKNEDFEYDLSNLLKMEAQVYNSYTNTKPVQTNTKTVQTNTKPVQTNTKPVQTSTKNVPNKKEKKDKADNAECQRILKECPGALLMLSRKTAQRGKALFKTSYNINTKERLSVFVRPMVPKILARGDKASPKKDVEETKTSESPTQSSKDIENEIKTPLNETQTSLQTPKPTEASSDISLARNYLKSQLSNAIAEKPVIDSKCEETPNKVTVTAGPDKTQGTIPAIVPIKFRRESLEVIKNPLINKNINDLKKAGMKTKILVIKPIHRNKDGPINSNLKYQTIKFNKSHEGSKNEKVVLVQVPKVDCNIKGPAVGNDKSTVAQTVIPNLDTSVIGDTEKERAKIQNGKPEESIIGVDESESEFLMEDTTDNVVEIASQNKNETVLEDNELLTLSGDSNANESNNTNTSIDSVEIVEATV